MASIRLLTYTVTSDGNKWGIAGVWAHGGFRAVAVSDGTLKSSTYIGLWSDVFKTNLGWMHVKSPSVIASMNNQWMITLGHYPVDCMGFRLPDRQ